MAKKSILARVWDALREPAQPYDSWFNQTTGAGDPGRDKMLQGFMAPLSQLDYGELESLYYGDDICEEIVDAMPDEAFRRGYELEDADENLLKEVKRLRINVKMRDADGWSRLWGGAAMVLGVDDGQTPDKPLIIERSKGLKFINVVDRRYINPISYYEQAMEEHFGLPELYQVTPAFGGSAQGVIIHETRLVRFWGTRIDPITTRRLAGWSYSALQRPYDVVRQFASGFQAAGQLLYDAGQNIFRMQNLIEQLSGPNRNQVLARLANVDMQRWSGRAVVIDKEGEDMGREPVSIAGVADLIDRFMMRVAAAANMPVTLLFGRSPAGMDATGESDMGFWYARVKAHQSNILEPALEKLLMVLTAGKWDGKIIWAGLEEPNDKDDAEVEELEAQTWKLYFDMGALSGEQIALAKFCHKPMDEVIDEDALEAVVESDYELARNPPPPPQVPPSGGGTPAGAASIPDGTPPGADPAVTPTPTGKTPPSSTGY